MKYGWFYCQEWVNDTRCADLILRWATGESRECRLKANSSFSLRFGTSSGLCVIKKYFMMSFKPQSLYSSLLPDEGELCFSEMHSMY